MEDEAELQEVFTVLRLVQALFLSAPMLYFQVLIIMSIGPQRAYHHHLILILSAGVSFLSLFIALTSFVLNPATDRPCRVRGWLISSKALLLGSALYFATILSALPPHAPGAAPHKFKVLTVDIHGDLLHPSVAADARIEAVTASSTDVNNIVVIIAISVAISVAVPIITLKMTGWLDLMLESGC
jgi:hypothetical protein